jgi:hypothetical protein
MGRPRLCAASSNASTRRFPRATNARGPALEFLQHPIAARLIMPQLVFVDRDGNIRAQYAGDDPFLNEDRQETNIRQKIDQLLAEGKK